MPFPYKRVLLVGATAGIGAAMADKLIQQGAKVIAVGRRQDRLDAFVQKHGPERASSIAYDITNTAGLDDFINTVAKTYPDLDCVFLNAGVQSPIRLSRPSEVNLDKFHAEINVNFTCIVNLCMKFAAVLLQKEYPTALVITGTHLSLVPAATLPAYSASKAALRAFFDCFRRQNQGKRCKFIEVSPPVVQSELHDYMGDHGRKLGMPVDEFVDLAYGQLESGSEHVNVGQPLGATAESYGEFVAARQKMFDLIADATLAHFEL